MLPNAAKVYDNPSEAELREFVAEMPNSKLSEFDNYNVSTDVVARSKASTYIVTTDPERHSDQTIDVAEYERLAALQDAYIANQEMIKIDGYIGSDPEFRTRARLFIEKANANIAAMQRQLYYPCDDPGTDPATTVIYTPNLSVDGYPNDRAIAVNLEDGVTRVFNSDYFGESKKGGLRMWNRLVYDRGGLSLHAGCKVVPVGDTSRTLLIVGLSGTGKTTTTFTKQNGSLPVQDDFVALMPGGRIYTTEDGCFAKTFGLDPEFEPTIHSAVTAPEAYLENVSQDDDGNVDFFDTSYTQNGRSTFEFAAIEHASGLGLTGDVLLILNRNENVIPAVAKLDAAQASAYFMLGETTGTSAGGKEEAGKFLRVPGTNPFYPQLHDEQGNRIRELLESHPLEVYLMNTGSVGGKAGDDQAKKVKIPHSSAVVKGIAEGTIEWVDDADFGYQVAAAIPDFDDPELLQPRKLYERQGRVGEYEDWVTRLKAERKEYFSKFPTLDPEIVAAVE